MRFFGRRLRMSTISTAPTLHLYGKYACACRSAQVQGLKVFNLFLEEKCSQQCLLVCLESSF